MEVSDFLQDDRTLWVGSPSGLYKLDLDSPSSLGLVESIPVKRLRLIGDTVWVVSDLVYRVRRAKPDQVEVVPVSIPGVLQDVFSTGEILWLGTHDGMYRVDLSKRKKVSEKKFGSGLDHRLFFIRTADGKLTHTLSALIAEEQHEAVKVETSAGPTFFSKGADEGWAYSYLLPQPPGEMNPPSLYRLRDDKANPIESIEVRIPQITFLLQHKDWLWLGTTSGLFRYSLEMKRVEPIGINLYKAAFVNLKNYSKEIGIVSPNVKWLLTDGGWLWIGSNRGLCRISLQEPAKQELVEGLNVPVNSLFLDHRRLWATTPDGVYSINLLSPQSATKVVHLQFPSGPLHRQGSTLWLGTMAGLFRLEGWDQEWINSGVKITSGVPERVYPDTALTFRWTLTDFGWRASARLTPSTLVVQDHEGKEALRKDVPAGVFETTLDLTESGKPILPPGRYQATVKVTDLYSKVSSSREPLTFDVSLNPWQVVIDWLKFLGVVFGVCYCLLNVFTFLVLVLFGRWWRWGFAILTHPQVRRFGIYYGCVFRHIRPLRLWVLEPYYQKARQGRIQRDHPYLQPPLRDPDNKPIQFTQLLQQIGQKGHEHLWIQGGSGTGKSELVLELLRRYAEKDSLRKAWKQFRFVPVLVRLRDMDRRSVEDMALEALEREGFPVCNDRFFWTLLLTKDFLILLDGLNEARLDERSRDDLVLKFVKHGPRARLLVTSQTPAPPGEMKTYTLQPTAGSFARELLAAFLNQSVEEVSLKVPSLLWHGVTSGYDVKLIANLISASQTVPKDRLNLYQASLQYAEQKLQQFSRGAVEQVCRLAWEKWLEETEHFPISKYVTEGVPNVLVETHLLVQHGQDHDVPYFGFPHEQLQGYLAARWATIYANTPIRRLEEARKKVWALSPTSQDRVFPFLAEIVAAQQISTKLDGCRDGLIELFEFALGAAAERVRLMTAVLDSAKRRGWQLGMGLRALELVEAMCDLADGEFETVITGLDIPRADVGGLDQRAQANVVYRLARRAGKLDLLHQLISKSERPSPITPPPQSNRKFKFLPHQPLRRRRRQAPHLQRRDSLLSYILKMRLPSPLPSQHRMMTTPSSSASIATAPGSIPSRVASMMPAC
jgi:ligand-binding sensor domain-containing protein